jgi:putative spermidine/putrescine transport system permease protein
MRANWGLILLPPMLFSFLLLGGTQFLFLRAGFFEDIGAGLIGDEILFDNYALAFGDQFYLDALVLNVWVSALVVLCALVCAYPVAYVIARMRSRQLALLLLAAIVVSSFVTIVIKALGLIILFGSDGPINRVLLAIGLLDEPVKIVGNVGGVVVGLMHYVLGFMVLMLFSVVQTIPRSLEEAAMIHGATRFRMFLRVVFPLTLPGVVTGGLIVFNLCMGAFVSAALLGGGQVLTLPVVIQRTIVLESSYALGGALSAILLVAVLLINLLSVWLLTRFRKARLVIT